MARYVRIEVQYDEVVRTPLNDKVGLIILRVCGYSTEDAVSACESTPEAIVLSSPGTPQSFQVFCYHVDEQLKDRWLSTID